MDIVNFLLSNLVDAFSEFLTEIMDWMVDKIFDIIQFGEKVALGNELSFVNSAFLLMQGIGTVLLCCMVGKQVITTYITETDGDPDAEPTQLLVKFSIAMAYIWAAGAFLQISIGWAGVLTDEILDTADIKFKGVLEALLMDMGGSAVTTSVVFFYVIGILVFAFKAAIRGAELTLMKILLPIFACDNITPSKERWNAFSFAALITVFGYVFQLFLFKVSLVLMVKGMDPFYVFAAGSFLYLAIKAPEWMKKFCYSSGLGQLAGRGGSSASFIIASMIRR